MRDRATRLPVTERRVTRFDGAMQFATKRVEVRVHLFDSQVVAPSRARDVEPSTGSPDHVRRMLRMRTTFRPEVVLRRTQFNVRSAAPAHEIRRRRQRVNCSRRSSTLATVLLVGAGLLVGSFVPLSTAQWVRSSGLFITGCPRQAHDRRRRSLRGRSRSAPHSRDPRCGVCGRGR